MSSPSLIPSSGPTDSVLAYPPAAKVKTDKQPTAKTEMVPRPSQETGAERLRGGCIPCPVRSIPSVAHCNFLTTFLTGRRMLLLYPHPLLLTACNPLPPSKLRTPIWTMDTMPDNNCFVTVYNATVNTTLYKPGVRFGLATYRVMGWKTIHPLRHDVIYKLSPQQTPSSGFRG